MKLSQCLSSVALTLAIATTASAEISITSTDISEGQQLNAEQVFQGFGCEGGNKSPSLSWTGAPDGTKSFAITAYDPDAPTGSGWWHWFAFNIPADVNELPAGSTLSNSAVELTNDYGTKGFGGACPPPGEVHRYQFTVYALPMMLEIDDSVSNALAGFMVQANAIAHSTLTAVYNR